MAHFTVTARLAVGFAALTVLSACDDPLDFDLRGRLGGNVDTSQAALTATAPRPRPDNRGIISYPNYQVVVARRGDSVADVAARIGMKSGELARYNGISNDTVLRGGEVLALPKRVAEPPSGPIRPVDGTSDITRIAGDAIDRAETPAVQTAALEPAPTTGAPRRGPSGAEPVRHKVERGETAFTIARLYNVTVRALADWNGLGPDFAVREGQFLLIPVAREVAAAPTNNTPTPPGSGSPTPTPPSATKPLPDETTVAAATPTPTPAAPDLGKTQTAASTGSSARMILPVDGRIIREFSKGRTDGIDIAGSAGTTVKAADSGRVGAITSDSSGQNIVVLKHADGLLTVYGNVGRITVKKGDSVSRGQKIAEMGAGDPAYVRFGVYKGSDAVDPTPYLE